MSRTNFPTRSKNWNRLFPVTSISSSPQKSLSLIDKYENFDTLTITMLNEFVEKIVVHERDRKGSQDTTQEVEIYFNLVGKYVPPHFGKVTRFPEEQDALRKKEERKDGCIGIICAARLAERKTV